MTSRRIAAWLAFASGFSVLGCKNDPSDVAPDQIVKVVASDAQTAPAGARLPAPLAVMVLTKDGVPVPRIRVRWKPVSSGGALSDSITVSDGTGRAQVDYTLPPTPGLYNVDAELVITVSRTTTLVASATAPPVISTISPTQVTGGTVVTIQGSGFTTSPLVDVSGAPARVTAATATTITAVTPLCLAPGAVNFQVRVAGAGSNLKAATYVASSGAVTLAVGEYAMIDPAQLASGCATFPTAGAGGAEYLLAPQSAAGTVGLNAAYRMTGDSTVTLVVSPGRDARDESGADAFHRFLRETERKISLAPNRPEVLLTQPVSGSAAVAAIKVGDKKSFKVCNKFGCSPPADFSKIEAQAKYVGDHIVVFQDVAAPAGGFTDDEFTTLGDGFDQVIYDLDTRTFGVESDIDGNGKVFILFTPVVNGITPRDQCATSVVTGFFFGIDLDPLFNADQRANQAEMFYALTPDAGGSASCAVTKAQVQRVVPSTFIHEFQHMINYNQHVLIRRAPAEEVWLNEGMSHLAEEIGGLRYQQLGQQQAYSDFVIGNLFNAYQYLKAPGSYFVLFDAGSGLLAERGGEWLFLRWIVDRFGISTMRRLEESRLIGAENIAAAVGEPVSRLLGEWFLANYTSDLPGFTAPARLRYESWAFRTTYASLNAQQPSRYDRPFPLVPQIFSGGSFTATGTVRAGSGDYFRVTQAAGQRGFGVRLTDPAGLALPPTVVARLNVVRIK
ncbi:MAG: hypothetical protein EXR93_06190 [Gemmatimonadetes bacterium]|nr:hypothetical protein [Gemmatimonadota bacterium]